MANNSWEKIEAFQSPMEFRRFVKWIEQQRDGDLCEEQSNDGDAWADRIFICKRTNESWVLKQPDPGYFAGSWMPLVSKAGV